MLHRRCSLMWTIVNGFVHAIEVSVPDWVFPAMDVMKEETFGPVVGIMKAIFCTKSCCVPSSHWRISTGLF